jgi:hypothetical protein
MTRETLTTEEQVEELRRMLADSFCHHRTVVRPVVEVGETVDPGTGRRFAKGGPGPVTVVTFYITHDPRGPG